MFIKLTKNTIYRIKYLRKISRGWKDDRRAWKSDLEFVRSKIIYGRRQNEIEEKNSWW